MDGDYDTTDLGDALTDLGDSMDDLSYGMAGLTDAVQQLQASTRHLSDQQADLASGMSQTAREFETAGSAPSASQSTAFGAADD